MAVLFTGCRIRSLYHRFKAYTQPGIHCSHVNASTRPCTSSAAERQKPPHAFKSSVLTRSLLLDKLLPVQYHMKRQYNTSRCLLFQSHTMPAIFGGCGLVAVTWEFFPNFKACFGLRHRYNSPCLPRGRWGNTTYMTSRGVLPRQEFWVGWKHCNGSASWHRIPRVQRTQARRPKEQRNGLGDITPPGYQPFDSRRKHPRTPRQWAGGITSLGKYNVADKTSMTTNTNLFQLGTGGVDYQLAVIYDARFKQTGFEPLGAKRSTA